MMKIAFLSVFYPYRGGISQFSGELYEAVRKEEEMVAFNFSRQYPDFIFPGKTQYVTESDKLFKVDSLRLLDSINPFSYVRTARAIRKSGADVVVISYWMSFFVPAIWTIAGYLRRRGVRVIALVHNAIPHEPKPWDKPLAKWFFRRCDGFVALCDAVSADIRSLAPGASIMQREHPMYEHFGTKISKEQAREKLGIPNNKKTLLFFGLIRDYKGLDLLIAAMNQLDESYHLVIAGECYGSFDKYERQIAALPHPGQVTVFNRYISDDEVPLFFSAADVCVLPYRSATQSGVTAVALNFSVPLIATRVGGLAQSIEEPGTGIITDAINPEAIAATVRRYFSEESQQYINHIDTPRKEMTWPAFASRFIEFCKE